MLSALPFTHVIEFTCAQDAIQSNLVLSVALISQAVLCVASEYVVSVALIVVTPHEVVIEILLHCVKASCFQDI